MTTPRITWAVAPATLALILTGGLTVAASPGHSADATIATVSDSGQDAYAAQVAVAADGTTTAVWERYDGADYRVQAAARPPGGAWTAAATLSAAGQDAFDPQLALGPDGTATAVWHRNDGSDYLVQAVTRNPAGTWGEPATLSGAGEEAVDAQVTVGPDGTTTVVWERFVGTSIRIQASSRPPGGAWAAPQNLSDADQDAASPQVTVGPDGTTTAVWYRFDGSKTRVQAATRPPGGAWAAPQNLSGADQEASGPQVTVGPDGTTTAVWQRIDGSNDYRIESAQRPPGGAWTSPVIVSEAGQDAVNAQVAVGRDGTAHAVWQRSDGATNRVQAALRAPEGSWTTPVTLSEAGQAAYDPQVAVGPDGTATTAWTRSDGMFTRTQTALLRPGSAWSPAVNLSDAGQAAEEPQVAIGADGTAVTAWTRTDGSNFRIQAIVYDDAFPPPVVVPETGKVLGKKVIKKAKAKYTFSSPNPGAAFECRVDKKFKKYVGVSKKKAKKQVPWKACSSPYAVKAKKLENGKHKLFVRAVLKGVADPTPSVKKVKVLR